MIRVAGADPGTSSLDLLVLEDGRVGEQVRFAAEDLRADPRRPVDWLHERGPFDLVAGPSGYGLPLVPAAACTPRDLALMTLVRPDERGRAAGVGGLSALLRELAASGLPVVFLPGAIHLPSVPVHRKLNRIDLGTPDKVGVAALALHETCVRRGVSPGRVRACVVELGTAFTAMLVLDGGQIVDGRGGSAGPLGWSAPGAWDGEAAYLLGPLGKSDLFSGGVVDTPDRASGLARLLEDVISCAAGLRAVTPFEEVILSGRLLEREPDIALSLEGDLGRLAPVTRLAGLPGAWVKHAAQGAALLADGLAGGRHAKLVAALQFRAARGSVLDYLPGPRAAEVRRAFMD